MRDKLGSDFVLSESDEPSFTGCIDVLTDLILDVDQLTRDRDYYKAELKSLQLDYASTMRDLEAEMVSLQRMME